MGKNEISARLKLEGEAQFKKGMKDAAESIKEIAAQEKLARAEFEATGDAQQYAADRAQLLRDKIAAQERAVASAEAAVKALNEQGFKPGDKLMREWTLKTVNAKTQLLNMKNALDKVEKELGEQTTALTGEGGLEPALDDTTESAKGTGEALEKIGEGVSYQNAISAIDTLRGHIADILSAVANVGRGMWDMESDAARWADSLATAASRAGMDPETYQSWTYASQFIDTSVDDILKARAKITQALADTDDDTAKLFNILMVPTRNEDGSERDATEVFWDVVDALGAIDDGTTRAIYAQQLFGESWTALQPLIESGSDAYKGLAEEGRDVAAVSQDNVDKLVALDDAQNRLNSAFQKARNTIAAELAPGFTSLADAGTAALNAFNDFLASEAGQTALQNLSNAIGGLLRNLDEEDFTNLINLAANALTLFTNGLAWVLDHNTLVISALTALAAAWGGLSIAKEVLTFLELIKSIKWLSVANAAKNLKDAASGGGMPSTGSGSDGGLGDVGKVFTDAHDEAPAGSDSSTLQRMGQGAKRLGNAVLTGVGKVAEIAFGPAAAVVGPAAGIGAGYALGRYLENVRTPQLFGEGLAAEAAQEQVHAIDAGENERLRRMQLLYDKYLAAFDSEDLKQSYYVHKASQEELAELFPGEDFGAKAGWYDELNPFLALNEYAIVAGNVLAKLKDEILAEDTRSGEAAEATQAAAESAAEAAQATAESVRSLPSLPNATEVAFGETEAAEEAARASARLKELYDVFAQAYNGGLGNTRAEYDAFMAHRDELARLLPGADFGARDAFWGMYSSFNSVGEYERVVQNVLSEIEKALNAADIGQEAAAGMAEGIAGGTPEAARAAADMGAAVDEALRGALDIHSPSGVMIANGEQTARGLAEGIRSKTASVVAAARQLAAQVSAALSGAYAMPSMGALQASPVYSGMLASSAGGGRASGGQTVLNATMTLNGRAFANVVTPIVNDTLPTMVTPRR